MLNMQSVLRGEKGEGRTMLLQVRVHGVCGGMSWRGQDVGD